MDYPEYERQEELAHQGDHIPEYMQALFDHTCCSDNTLASLQRRMYKDTEAGITISFEMDDQSFIWSGDPRATDTSLIPRVLGIGFSSIVEGSDAEVPLQWLYLLNEEYDTVEKFLAEFDLLTEETNDEACRLWDEEHADDED